MRTQVVRINVREIFIVSHEVCSRNTNNTTVGNICVVCKQFQDTHETMTLVAGRFALGLKKKSNGSFEKNNFNTF